MKNILLVVDVQNGFLFDMHTCRAAKRIGRLLATGIFDVVVATKFKNSKNSIFENVLGWRELETEEEQQLAECVEKYADWVEEKYTYSCINTNFLQRLCQLNGGEYPDRVFIAGLDTDCCVLASAIGLFEHNIKPVVLSSYCASTGGPEAHKAGLDCLQRLIGEEQILENEVSRKEDLETI